MRPLTSVVLRIGLFLTLLLTLLAGLARADNAQLIHTPWEELLHKHVTAQGHVDYEGFLEDEDKLLDYLLQQRKIVPSEQSWSAAEIKAYWLNVYNASAVYMVLQYYPLYSINDIRVKTLGSKLLSPWDAASVKVGGKVYSLNQIEHQILQARFPDPRLHFALVQTAVSGPSLLNEAYDGSRLDQQLDLQARRFINDPLFNNLAGCQVQLSGLFQYYAADFSDQSQLLAFINRYARVPVTPDAQVNYLPFSWSLNDRKAFAETQAHR